MKEKLLFQTFHEMYESFSSAGALPNDLSILGTRVQTSGKGNPDYPLTMVAIFHSFAGENWEEFCELYSPTGKLSNKFIARVGGKLTHFWRKIDRYRSEFEALARYYLDKHK